MWKSMLLSSIIFGFPFFPLFNLGYFPQTAVAETPDISWFDSRTKPGESYLMIDECFVALETSKATKDFCYIQKQIKKQCGIADALGEKCGK